MLTHRGFEAWIVAEGGIMPFEFKTCIDHSRNVVTCWIPCEVGKASSITLLIHIMWLIQALHGTEIHNSLA